MLNILIKWTKEISLGLYFLGTIVCVNYIDHMDKRHNFRFILFRDHCVLTILIKWTKEIIFGLYFLGTIVCVNYNEQTDKRNNFRFILFRDHCVC